MVAFRSLFSKPVFERALLILFADDLGYGNLSSYGHPTIRTPYLNRMADEGIRLTSPLRDAFVRPLPCLAADGALSGAHRFPGGRCRL